MTDTVLSLENVSIDFTKSKLFGLAESDSLRAVNDVTLEIEENEVIALVGESGCGKTTLGKTAIGLNRPSTGTVSYRGQDIWETKDRSGLMNRFLSRGDDELEYTFGDIRRSLQIIHQDPESSLDANSTIGSILSEPLKRWEPELSKADRRERIYGFLDYVGLSPPQDFADRYPHQMSGGQQQRVALVRSLLMKPDLILADESISALDVSLRVNMMDLMLQLQDAIQTSYLFITHDLSNARYMTKKSGGRIGIMYLGELVEIGHVDEIINNPQHPYTKTLLWATPDLGSQEALGQTEKLEDAPLRRIDVPDISEPPSGCSFHPRCPEAREACREEDPVRQQITETQEAACFRTQDDHPYWDSDEIVEEDAVEVTSSK